MAARRPLALVLATSLLAAACGGGGGGGGGSAQGDGTLSTAAVPAIPTTSAAHGLVAADFDGDGTLDLAISTQADDVRVYLGQGDGTFVEQADGPFPTAADPGLMAVADFDEDDVPDLAVACFTSARATILLGDGDGSFTTGTPVIVGTNVGGVAAGFLDHDEHADLLVSFATAAGQHRVAIFLGVGDGTFVPGLTPHVTAQAPTRGISIADLDDDGDPDFAVANYGGSGSVSLFRGAGNGTFTLTEHEPVTPNPFNCLLVKVDDDEFPDLVAPSHAFGGASVRLGAGNGTVLAGGTPHAASDGTSSLAVGAGDFDEDGATDLVVANFTAGSATVLLGVGDGTFTGNGQGPLLLGTAPQHVIVADFDEDGVQDVALAGSGFEIAVLLGNRR
jgi:hypothetical protein